MEKTLIILTFVVLLWGCDLQNNNEQTDTQSEDADVKNIYLEDGGQYHFPTKLLIDSLLFFEPDVVRVDTFRLEWFSQVLTVMNEPPLYKTIQDKEIYRFTILEPFHPEIVIALEKVNGQIYLIEKRANTVGRALITNPGTINDLQQLEGGVGIDEKRQVNIDVWNNFEKLIQQTSFRKMPTTISNDLTTDGTTGILEMYKPGEYHFVTRWSLDDRENHGLKKLSTYLLNISCFKENK